MGLMRERMLAKRRVGRLAYWDVLAQIYTWKEQGGYGATRLQIIETERASLV